MEVRPQISISNPNLNKSMFQIQNCVFDSAKEYAIEAVPTEPADTPLRDHLSAILTVDHCKFDEPKAVLKNYCDYAGINNCWVAVSSPPMVSSISPAKSATAIDVGTTIVIVFSQNMLPSTITTSNITLMQGASSITISISLSEDKKTVTITPSEKLRPSTVYTISVTTGLKNLAGRNIVTECETTFTTAVPTVSSTTPNGTTTNPSPPSYAIFYNMHGGIHFHNMYGEPGFPAFSGCRWIDNYGSVFVDDSRFGGEGGGMPVVYHYADHALPPDDSPDKIDTSVYNVDRSVVIRNSWVFNGRGDPKLGRDPDDAVLNLRTDIPLIFIYEGNFGPSDNFLIVNGGGFNLEKRIKSLPSDRFRFEIQPNLLRVHKGIPDELRSFVNFLELEKLADFAPPTKGWNAGQRLENSSPELFWPYRIRYMSAAGQIHTVGAVRQILAHFQSGLNRRKRFLTDRSPNIALTYPQW